MLNKSNFEDVIRVLSTIFIAVLLISENTLQVNCQSLLNEKNSSRNSGHLRKLIFTEGNRINAIDPNGENFIELARTLTKATRRPDYVMGSSDFVPYYLSPVFSCERKILYWIESETKIRAFDYFKSQSSGVIFEDDSSELKGLALDFINDKLYVINSALTAIEVVDLKTGIRGIILTEVLPAIDDIAIDPEEGYLFILGQSTGIRTDLDGSNCDYIFHWAIQEEGFLSEKSLDSDIVCIVLDTIEKRIYWVNESPGTTRISSSTYSGTNKKIHLQYKVDMFDDAYSIEYRSPLAFISNTPYWIDKIHGVIKTINSSNFNDGKIIYNGKAEEMSTIASIDCNPSHHPQQAIDPCKEKNGGCQHLCIASRSSKRNYRCFCKIGYELGDDGKSCILPTNFIMFFKNGFVRGVNWREDIKQYVEVLDPTKYHQTKYSLMEVDIKERMVFYFDHNSTYNALYGINLNEKKNFILNPYFPATEVTKIAFDWASKNLYYISTYCKSYNTLRVLNTKNPTYSKILARAAKTNHLDFGLAVHPNRGYVYFVETNGGFHFNSPLTSNVTRIYTDGSNSTMVLKMRKQITCIAVDYNEEKLYWSELQVKKDQRGSGYDYVESILYYSNLDGEKITEVHDVVLIPVSLSIQENWIYALNAQYEFSLYWQRGRYNFNTMTKMGGPSERLSLDDVDGLKIFDPSTQITESDHPCASSGNTCDKFCFAVPNTHTTKSLQRVCGCPYGEKLAENGRSCVANSKEEPPESVCSVSKADEKDL